MAVDDPDANLPEGRAPGRGCNLVAVAIVLILIIVFAAAAWVNAPSDSPQPVDTGVPPTAPTG